MRLGWDEIKRRAKAFSDEWKDAHYERGQTQTFYNEFFEIFGIKRKQVAIYEQRVKLLNNRHGFIDLFWPGTLLVEQKSASLDLGRAQGQALDYVEGIHPTQQPRWVLSCDFQTWVLLDLETRTQLKFRLADLHKHITAFDFMLGRKVSFETQAGVTIKAAELMGKLHDALEETGYVGHDLEQLLVRLLFCLFADDTGIFQPKDIFLQLVENDTRPDGSDVGRVLNDLFDVLDTPENARQSTLQAELNAFPYVNGRLFAKRVRTPHFTQAMRDHLLDAARHDWSGVSPAIFGSLFQSVMDAKERRAKGAHYTTEANIMKVIGPLFLDDLKSELATIIARKTGRDRALGEFQNKLARLTFFDPACGCGNFLVIAYREIRALELEALKAQYGDQQIDAALLSRVTVDQFYGIEYEEFPARIAEVAMWMMDHISNNAINEAFRLNYARIPLKDSAHILHGDALEADWAALLPPEKCSYIMGNPPFIGQSYQSLLQRDQMARVINATNGKAGSLDYVAAWFIKAGQYVQDNRRIRIAFVATNSITQGEQVAQLWPILFDRHGLEIAFAHRTFSWLSEAKGKAHVHVVIIGLAHRDHEPTEKRLFSYPDIARDPVESRHMALTAYLFDAKGVANRHLMVRTATVPLSAKMPMRMGSKPVDGGHLIFDAGERQAFLDNEPNAQPFMVPFIGAQEYISGNGRWILSVSKAAPDLIRAMPSVQDRLRQVRDFRAASRKSKTRELASYPSLFEVTTIPATPYLAIPEVSSERRDYVPIGWLEPPTIPSNKLLVVLDATLWDFGILTSGQHMAWLGHVGGRLESRFQYSPGMVYNTFPWPDATPAQRAKIEELAQAVLDARAAYPTSSLADLYDPDTMPADLRRAHAALDRAVDRLYRAAPFETDRDRVEHLFGRYEALVNPLERLGAAKNRRVARKAGQDAGGG
ncbi:SAM-dependent methyltransferase [Sphingobium xenophagum]|uniref:site-specific DNA-methyltransferase (adenine-specific) n=1 Tax=Sphingobium xenophagum TaxID=121428 RepID=A0A249MPP7_SPHXE|nr:DNA methyltransferase [Sphingobium xenophagum]ASY43155.1 SAM-dependent methyltransferase [Sphingobium xenophagum]